MRSAHIPHDPVRKIFLLPSRTQQSFAEETDINRIMAKYQKTGMLDHINEHGAHYGDQPAAEDFHAAMSMVASTNSLFEELPSSVRDEFDNDPSLFLDYVADDERRADLVRTGEINHSETPAEEPETPETPVEPGAPA